MKNGINKKVALGSFALLCLVGIIGLCSFFPFIIDPKQWMTADFLSRELIISSISIFSMICLMFMAQASNAQNPRSEIAKAKVRFLGDGKGEEGSVNRIMKHDLISAFAQWVRTVLQPNDIMTAKQKIMMKSGIQDFSLIKLDNGQLRSLIDNAREIDGKVYHSITKKQYNAILYAKDYKVELVDFSYYLTCEKYASDRTITEQSAMEAKKKTTLLTYSIVSKVFMSVIIAMIFTSLIADTTQSVPMAKAWMDFTTKLFSMMTSAFLGYNVGCQLNDIDAYYVNLKCRTHDMFIEDKAFKPKTLEELAEEELKNEKVA